MGVVPWARGPVGMIPASVVIPLFQEFVSSVVKIIRLYLLPTPNKFHERRHVREGAASISYKVQAGDR